ncbi:hypothetical protein LEMLEM_LOCUS18560, partial [Lemmus lemmus]
PEPSRSRASRLNLAFYLRIEENTALLTNPVHNLYTTVPQGPCPAHEWYTGTRTVLRVMQALQLEAHQRDRKVG